MSDFIRPLLELYNGSSHGELGGRTLKEELRLKWSPFSEKLSGKEELLVNEIVPESGEWAQLKYLKVYIGFEVVPDLNPLIVGWENFKDEIMYRNRFFFRTFKSKHLEKILKFEEPERFIEVETELYRGRLCGDDALYTIEDMGKPNLERKSISVR